MCSNKNLLTKRDGWPNLACRLLLANLCPKERRKQDGEDKDKSQTSKNISCDIDFILEQKSLFYVQEKKNSYTPNSRKDHSNKVIIRTSFKLTPGYQ